MKYYNSLPSGRALERRIRRSEVRFLMGTQNFFLCPTPVTRQKNIFLKEHIVVKDT